MKRSLETKKDNHTTCSWYDRYTLALSECLTIKDVMLLRNVGQPTALKIRKEALEYCIKNNIDLPPRGVPTEAVLSVTNKDLNYYYQKMISESEAKKYLC